MAYQLKDINRMAAEHPEDFLARADTLFASKVRTAADRIAENLRQSPIVLLSGPSGSGKTTSALKIEEELNRRGIRTHTVSMDNYFRPLTPEDAPGPRTAAMTWSPPCAWIWPCSMSTSPP